MSSRRTAKVAEAIRETVSSTVLFGLKDPRVKNVTVIRAEVTADLRNAKVYVSVRGDEKLQALTMHGLNAARGFIQSKVADRLQTKFTPILQFVFDPGVHLSVETSAIIREALRDNEGKTVPEADAPVSDAPESHTEESHIEVSDNQIPDHNDSESPEHDESEEAGSE